MGVDILALNDKDLDLKTQELHPPRLPPLRKRALTSKPPFTLGELKTLVPLHCFERSLLWSSFYLVRDLAVIYLLYYVASNYIPHLAWPLRWVAWPVYWIIMGTFAFALWTLGHECGHHAFSSYHWLNDAIGFLVHSSMLLPYFSWKSSHVNHHKNTGTLEKDEAYVPRQNKPSSARRILNFPAGRIFLMIVLLTIGYPIYLLFHNSGRKYPRRNNHFDPSSPMFPRRIRPWVIVSDLGVLATLAALAWLAYTRGLAWVAAVYWVPLTVVNSWAITVTLLNHIHAALPHYDDKQWTWLLGTLTCIMDRDFGWFLNHVFHNQPNAHIVHHLFPKIPHYHLQETTRALKPKLKEYYQCDPTPPHLALYQTFKECAFVKEDDENKGIYWYSEILSAMMH